MLWDLAAPAALTIVLHWIARSRSKCPSVQWLVGVCSPFGKSASRDHAEPAEELSPKSVKPKKDAPPPPRSRRDMMVYGIVAHMKKIPALMSIKD